MKQLEDLQILVTGASSGLGASIARYLHAEGATVVLSARRDPPLRALAAELDGRAHVLPLDVTDTDQVEGEIADWSCSHGPIDGLVNNSGVADTASILDVSSEAFDKVLTTNLRGAFFVAKAVARQLIDAKRPGAIVNVASTLALKPLAGVAPYAMSKAGMVHMTKCMGLEWARHGVRVNAICPGYIETELNAEFFASPPGQSLIKTFPRRRLGQPDHLHGLVAYLLSRNAELINGAIIPADDGFANT